MGKMIYYFIPYATDKRLGRAFNQSCSIVPNDSDWIVLMDADTMFLNPNYGRIIADTIEQHGDSFSVFTCYSSRSGCHATRYKDKIWETKDLVELHNMSVQCEEQGSGVTEIIGEKPSGFFLLFKKSLWNQIKFSEEKTILHIDHMWLQKAIDRGHKIARINNLLIVHYYRLKQGRKNKSHLLV
jgi:GT2 family glycosyltransferase